MSSDGDAGDGFGVSVSICDNYVIVGAVGDDDNGSGSGSAYIFKYENESWIQKAKLLPTDGKVTAHFGNSVSMSGNYCIIGAAGDNHYAKRSGSAYIFKRDGENWVQQEKLIPLEGGEYDDHFGLSVCINGKYAIIGMPGDDDFGSAYVFKRDGESWTQECKLISLDIDWFDYFGCRVYVSDDYAIVGAYGNSDRGTRTGSAYVFKREGISWTQKTKLLPADIEAGDKFGNSVCINGGHAIVGAYNDDDNGNLSGSAYIYKREGENWIQETKLLSSDGNIGDFFGSAVTIYNDLAIVGAYGDDDNEFNSGSAYVFRREPDNNRPIADAGTNQIAYAWIDGIAEVTLDGTGSYDDDGQSLTYLWSWTIDSETYDVNGVTPVIELPVGEQTIELIVNDGIDDSEPDEVIVTVVSPMESYLRIAPRVIDRRSRQPAILALVRFPEGVTTDQIDSGERLLLYPGGIEAISQRVTESRKQGVSIFALFDKDELMDAVGDNGSVELQVVGQLKTGQYFYGTDTVRIIGFLNDN